MRAAKILQQRIAEPLATYAHAITSDPSAQKYLILKHRKQDKVDNQGNVKKTRGYYLEATSNAASSTSLDVVARNVLSLYSRCNLGVLVKKGLPSCPSATILSSLDKLIAFYNTAGEALETKKQALVKHNQDCDRSQKSLIFRMRSIVGGIFPYFSPTVPIKHEDEVMTKVEEEIDRNRKDQRAAQEMKDFVSKYDMKTAATAMDLQRKVIKDLEEAIQQLEKKLLAPSDISPQAKEARFDHEILKNKLTAEKATLTTYEYKVKELKKAAKKFKKTNKRAKAERLAQAAERARVENQRLRTERLGRQDLGRQGQGVDLLDFPFEGAQVFNRYNQPLIPPSHQVADPQRGSSANIFSPTEPNRGISLQQNPEIEEIGDESWSELMRNLQRSEEEAKLTGYDPQEQKQPSLAHLFEDVSASIEVGEDESLNKDSKQASANAPPVVTTAESRAVNWHNTVFGPNPSRTHDERGCAVNFQDPDRKYTQYELVLGVGFTKGRDKDPENRLANSGPDIKANEANETIEMRAIALKNEMNAEQNEKLDPHFWDNVPKWNPDEELFRENFKFCFNPADDLDAKGKKVEFTNSKRNPTQKEIAKGWWIPRESCEVLFLRPQNTIAMEKVPTKDFFKYWFGPNPSEALNCDGQGLSVNQKGLPTEPSQVDLVRGVWSVGGKTQGFVWENGRYRVESLGFVKKDLPLEGSGSGAQISFKGSINGEKVNKNYGPIPNPSPDEPIGEIPVKQEAADWMNNPDPKRDIYGNLVDFSRKVRSYTQQERVQGWTVLNGDHCVTFLRNDKIAMETIPNKDFHKYWFGSCPSKTHGVNNKALNFTRRDRESTQEELVQGWRICKSSSEVEFLRDKKDIAMNEVPTENFFRYWFGPNPSEKLNENGELVVKDIHSRPQEPSQADMARGTWTINGTVSNIVMENGKYQVKRRFAEPSALFTT